MERRAMFLHKKKQENIFQYSIDFFIISISFLFLNIDV